MSLEKIRLQVRTRSLRVSDARLKSVYYHLEPRKSHRGFELSDLTGAVHYSGRSPWQHITDASKSPEAVRGRQGAMMQAWQDKRESVGCREDAQQQSCSPTVHDSSITALVLMGGCVI